MTPGLLLHGYGVTYTGEIQSTFFAICSHRRCRLSRCPPLDSVDATFGRKMRTNVGWHRDWGPSLKLSRPSTAAKSLRTSARYASSFGKMIHWALHAVPNPLHRP
jgi:hypothetical protein